MSTYREIVYIILSELKIESDDSFYNEDYMLFLINKYRPLILKQRYSDIRKAIPDANFQSINIDLEDSPEVTGDLTGAMRYRKSTVKIPLIMNLFDNQRITTVSSYNDYWSSEITYVNKDRFKYTGYNKWLTKIVYASINPDEYLYLKSADTNITTLNKVKVTSIFEDPIEVNKLNKDNNGKIKDPLDIECPFEANLIPILVQMIVKEILPSQARDIDSENNASDDSPDGNTNQRNPQYKQQQ